MRGGNMRPRAEAALLTPALGAAVKRATDSLRTRKDEATESLGNWEAWRERGREIRAHTIANLDAYLARFAESVQRRGGNVHFALDAGEAREIAARIVGEAGGRLVVKSKSMVTEEIRLNDRLEEDGVRVVETDLGEYILQLAHEKPSHIIAPAIHKTKEEIRQLLSHSAGRELPSDVRALLAHARETLRQLFLSADVGITGANFAIASTGTVVLFTNEGNADLSAAMPRVQIVVMGMERILPSFEDLEVFARLLPMSGTGQDVITYMTCLTGPRREGEEDGPREFHVIVLDGGRSNALGDPDFQEALHCIRCGACLNVCPVYREIGGHAYGSVYPGPIGAVLTPILDPRPDFSDLPWASSLCGACAEACPVKIPLPDMLVRLRERNVERGFTGSLERAAMRGFGRMFSGEGPYLKGLAKARSLQRLVARGGKIDAKIGPLSGWTGSRTAPAVAPRSFHDLWPDLRESLGKTVEEKSEDDG